MTKLKKLLKANKPPVPPPTSHECYFCHTPVIVGHGQIVKTMMQGETRWYSHKECRKGG